MSIRESVHVGQFNQQIRNDVIGHVRQTSQIKKKRWNPSPHLYHFVFSNQEQRSREPLLHNQYFRFNNDSVSSSSFPLSVCTDLLSFVQTRTLEPLKAQSMAMKPQLRVWNFLLLSKKEPLNLTNFINQ